MYFSGARSQDEQRKATNPLYDVETFWCEMITKGRLNGEDNDIAEMLEDMEPEVTDIWPATTNRHAPQHMLR